MHAARPPFPIRVLCDIFFTSNDAWVVAAVAAEVEPAVSREPAEQVDMARQVAGCVDDVEGAVGEEVERVREGGERRPGL